VQENKLDAEEVPTTATSLSVEPQSINFGCLELGHEANATLRVRGGPGQVILHSDRLRVTPISFGSESTELQLTLLGGSIGELIWADVLLRGCSGELEVLVTARWEEVIAKPEPEAGPEPIPPKPPPEQKERPFKARACRWCGKNIRYDTNSGLWKECENCKGARKAISVTLRLTREVYLGAREAGASLREIWGILVGKER